MFISVLQQLSQSCSRVYNSTRAVQRSYEVDDRRSATICRPSRYACWASVRFMRNSRVLPSQRKCCATKGSESYIKSQPLSDYTRWRKQKTHRPLHCEVQRRKCQYIVILKRKKAILTFDASLEALPSPLRLCLGLFCLMLILTATCLEEKVQPAFCEDL